MAQEYSNRYALLDPPYPGPELTTPRANIGDASPAHLMLHRIASWLNLLYLGAPAVQMPVSITARCSKPCKLSSR